MARSFYAIVPGIVPPQALEPGGAELLVPQDLWARARTTPPSLLFRVRSESKPGERLGAGDRLESCVGIIDASVRWRVVFALTRGVMNSLRHAALRRACSEAMGFLSSQHPAGISLDQRSAIIGGIGNIIQPDSEDKEMLPHPFEQQIAVGVMHLLQSENDIEAAHQVPFMGALCPFDPKKDAELFEDRRTTIEALTGSVLLAEAFNRLGEKAPVWMYAQMPELGEKGEE